MSQFFGMEQSKKKILIAEDEKPMATALQLKLTKNGFDADIAGNGEEALQKIDAGGVNLLILDLMMPKVDGFGVLTALKEKGVKIPVIVASNLSQKEDEEKAKALGAVDYFVKSNVAISDIVDKIKSHLV